MLLQIAIMLRLTLPTFNFQIRTAYRKGALKCHPDKNPDNPKAADHFRELSEAFEILSDTSAKVRIGKYHTYLKRLIDHNSC